MNVLPVDKIIPEIQQKLEDNGVLILIAPPGAGKSTRVPAKLSFPGRIVLVQPRRAAAQLIAARIASERKEELGKEVGYQIRFERKISRESKICVVTEGILLRWLQADPWLEGIDLVILDEFHERSLQLDMAVGMLKEARDEARNDLKILVMSATMNPAPIQNHFGADCPLLKVEGRQFPVEIRHDPKIDSRPTVIRCAELIRKYAPDLDGDMLVFLPGKREIADVQDELGSVDKFQVLPLHGQLSMSEQNNVIRASKSHRIILSTNIAETSLTLPNVRGVIDSGLHRVSHGADASIHLKTETISLDSADQRAGRAGRVAAGWCHRMWTRDTESRMKKHREPEIKRADLCGPLLQIFSWGSNSDDFSWMERPPEEHVRRAHKLLNRLGAVNESGLTEIGSRLAGLPVHPSSGRMLIEAEALNCLEICAAIAVIATEGDPIGDSYPDLLDKAEILLRRKSPRRHMKAIRQLRSGFTKISGSSQNDNDIHRAIIAGYPDRVGRRRKDKRRYQLADGSEAKLHKSEGWEWIIAPVLGRLDRGFRSIRHATKLDHRLLECTREISHVFDGEKVINRTQEKWGEIVIREKQGKVDPLKAAELLKEAVREKPDLMLKPAKNDLDLRARISFISKNIPHVEMPDFSKWEPIIDQICHGKRSLSELRNVSLAKELHNSLSWKQRKALEEHAPSHMKVPSGAEIRLEYPSDGPPILSARIQQLFGMSETPKLAGIKIKISLLAPNNRPQQQTTDLRSFWEQTYPQIRKELRGRYPKHAWPEKPDISHAQNRPKRRH